MDEKVKNIKAGDSICVEYGVAGNYVPFKVRAVFATDTKIMILADSKIANETFVFQPDETVLLVPKA